MGGKMFLVPGVVGILGLVSAALGFCAEVYKIKGSQVHLTASGKCLYPQNTAFGMALTAALALAMAHVIVSVTSGCCCCHKRNNAGTSWNFRRISGLVAAIASWFAFTIAIVLFVAGAELNRTDRHEMGCSVIKPGVFSAAGALSLFAAVLGIFSYVSFYITSSEQSAGSRPNKGGSVTAIHPDHHEHNASGGIDL